VFIRFSDRQKKELAKPFGSFCTLADVKKSKRKIIAVGDETTLNLIRNGLSPHLAVCDFKIKRKKIKQGERKEMIGFFGKVRRVYKNPPGTLSSLLLRNAEDEIKKGGLIRIIGEEDITALAFMLFSDKKYLVLYGQPNCGLVMVKPEKKELKSRIKKLLGEASNLRHPSS